MTDIEDKAAQLRREAEAVLAREPIALVNPQPGEELLHKLLNELQVHQVELLMQNEELRQMQVVMEASRDSYVDLFDFAPIGYITLSREGTVNTINLTAADMLGVVRRQLLSRRFSQYVAEEDRDRWHRHFISVVQHNQRQRCELTILRGDGTRFHARLDSIQCNEFDKTPQPGAINGWVSTVRIALSDVSERIQNEVAIEEARGLATSLMDMAHDALVVLDGALKVVTINQSFCERYGVTLDEAKGNRIYNLGDGQWNMPKLKELLENDLQHAPFIKNFEIEQDLPAIGKRKLHLNAQRITDKAGETKAILLALNDVTGQIE